VINQVRLLRRTSLLVALEANPALNRDQTRRLRELRETFHIGEEPAVPAAEPVAPPEEAPAEEPVVEEVRLSEEEFVDQHLSEDEKKTERVSVVKKLFNMTTAGKVIAALKGGREERAILIRDPNRIVASAVLGSPRVTGAEVETFAGMKNVSDEILRSIGTNRAQSSGHQAVGGGPERVGGGSQAGPAIREGGPRVMMWCEGPSSGH